MKRRRVLATGLLIMALTACTHHAAPSTAAPQSSPSPIATQSANIAGGPSASAPTSTATGAPTAKSTPKPTAKPTRTPGTAAACNGGKISFGTISRPWVLTQVTPVIKVPTSGSYTIPPATSVATVQASIAAGPQVPQMTLYRAFATRAGFDPDAKLLGEVYNGSDMSFTQTKLSAGKYVLYRSVHAVQAAFTYKCGAGENGKPYEGFAKSSTSEFAGVINCSASLPSGSRADAKAARAYCTKPKS